MEMCSKDVHTTKLALALLSFWIFLANAIVTGQYSSYLPESSYSSPSSSSSSSSFSSSRYGNENQKNYYDNPPTDSNSAVEYSTDPYRQRQQFQYETDDFDEQDSYNTPHHYQPQANYQQDYLSEDIYPYRQNQAQDSYGRPYPSHQYDDLDQDPSALVSFDNTGFNRSEPMNYQATADEVKYPPLDSEPHQLHHHHTHHPHQSPTKQQHLRAAHYTSTNNYMSSPTASARLNALSPYMANEDEKLLPQTSSKDHHTVHSNIDALMMVLNKSLSASAPPRIQHEPISPHQRNVRTNQIQSEEEPQQDQQHHHQHSSIGKESQVDAHYEFPFANNNNNTSSLMTQTFHVADDDSDLSSANSYHHQAAQQSQLQFDAHTLSLLQKYLVQHPHVVSSSPQALPVSLPAPFPLGNPIPIRQHVEITKHVPVPVYRQVHVPFRKAVRIEIPRPVISTIPRPYPIKIPTVTKTVAVPNVREVKIPIEKVIPYPVENRVPYIVQKRVPFEVEKQIAVPKYYPFPVKVPLVRTIMHKKKPLLLQHHHHSFPLEYFQKHHI